MALRVDNYGSFLLSNWNGDLAAAQSALTSGTRAGKQWKVALDTDFKPTSDITLTDLIVLDRYNDAKLDLSGAGKITFAGMGFSRRVLESEDGFITGASVTGRNGNGGGGSTNLAWQNAAKYPRRLRASLIDSSDLSAQLDVLDKAIGAGKFVELRAQEKTISSRVVFNKRRKIYLESGFFPTTYGMAEGQIPFILDSDTIFTGDGDSAKLGENANARGDRKNYHLIAPVGYLNIGAANTYQAKDISVHGFWIEGNGLVDTVTGTPQGTQTPGNVLDSGHSCYNGAGGASLIMLGSTVRGKVYDMVANYIHGYFVQMGDSGSLGVHADYQEVNGNTIVGSMSQMIALSSVRWSEINHNKFYEIAPYINSNIGVVDFEPNVPQDILEEIELRGNKFFFARPGDKNTQTGLAHPEKTVLVPQAPYNNGAYSRVFQAIHVKKTNAAKCNRIAVLDNEISGGFACTYGIYATETSNSIFERNRIREVTGAHIYVRGSLHPRVRGNTFEGDSPSTGFVWSQSNVKGIMGGDEFFQSSGANGNEKYYETEIGFSNVTMTAGGLMNTSGGSSDQGMAPWWVGKQFLITHINGTPTGSATLYTLNSLTSIVTGQTTYSGAALTNATIEWRLNDTVFIDSTTLLAKTMPSTGSKSRIFKAQEVTPGLHKGTNYSLSATAQLAGSSTNEGLSVPTVTNDGLRHYVGVSPFIWVSGAAPSVGTPQGVEHLFDGVKTVKEFDVTFQRTNSDLTTPIAANETSTQTATDFKIQYSSTLGGSYVDVPDGTFTGNTLAWVKVPANLEVAKWRVWVTASGSTGNKARISEMEAWSETGTY